MTDEPTAPAQSSSSAPEEAPTPPSFAGSGQDEERAAALLGIEDPPTTFAGTLRRLGPGLIIAGSIVGSGELIATTKTGAQAGFTLLWLILIGCVIKVFVQIELGRYTISSGDTCLVGLNRVPGPRLRVNWIVWFWVAMTLFGLAQLGGIVGGVGQALAISFPIRGDYLALVAPNATPGATDRKHPPEPTDGNDPVVEPGDDTGGPPVVPQRKYTWDDKFWAVLITAATIVMLARGRYGFVQAVATALVVAFTLLTLGNVASLQFTDQWHVSVDDVLAGLSFQVPHDEHGRIGPGLLTALATFGIIGVGASELIAYPYWCLEKGYARFAGPRSPSPGWVQRARGWMMVMHYDVWLSMVIYTVATLAFYILGAAVLNRMGQDPDAQHMVPILANAYVPVFGVYAKHLFLLGAFAVLYSTFFVATAGISRVAADALILFGFIARGNEPGRLRAVSTFCVLFPIISISAFLQGWNPVTLVLASGVMQSLMLPMLAGAALYFRYRRSDRRLRPGQLWNVLLWISCFGLVVAGGATAYNQIAAFLGQG